MAQVEIEKLDSHGRGIGYINDKIIFVPKSIPSEVCEVDIIKSGRTFQEGKLTKILKSSEKRKTPKCPYYDTCGGCDLEHISYEEGILWKQNSLEELFLHAKLWHQKIEIESCENPWNYRNKISLKVQDGKIGFYSSLTHHLVEIGECVISRKSLNKMLQDFSLYSIKNGDIIIRSNENDEILMDIITDEEVKIDQELFTRHKIVGILVNHKCAYGSSFFYERKNGVLYQVSMDSFFQVNPEMSSKLFLYVREILQDSKQVLDLYCGVGTLGLQITKKDTSLTGIEIVPSAILNAIQNAKLNHYENTSFHVGKVEHIMSKIPNQFDTVIVDPPRSGMDQKTKETLLNYHPQKILYVSCNPMTLIRDLKELQEIYEIASIRGFDMFPYTKHVECVVVLCLR